MSSSRRSNSNNNNNQQRSVAAHVRDRQRAVAEREASRLARPAAAPTRTLGHANRLKSAVTSTPSGILPTKASSSINNANGSNREEWCGPLAIARQMIAAREQARREREEEAEGGGGGGEAPHPLDQAMQELEQERKRKEHPSLQWKPQRTENVASSKSSSSWYAKRQRTSENARVQIPSLLDLCLQFLVDHFEHAESLGEIGPEIRTQIAAALVAVHKLNGDALQALTHVGMESLELLDASGITADELQRTLEALLPAGLRYLCLDQCGRCFGHKAVQVLLQHERSLVALSIGGAYLLKDAEAAQLLQEMKQLSSIDFKACPLLGMETCRALATAERSTPLVELALEDLTLNPDAWQALCEATSLRKLERLKLCRMTGLTDDIVTKLLSLTAVDGDCSLQALDLSQNYDLTDTILEAIRQFTSPSLRSLTLSGLGQLSASALEAFFTLVDRAAPPPRLAVLELANLDHEAITDDVIKAALLTSANARGEELTAPTNTTTTITTTTTTTTNANKTGRDGLVRLNVQGAKQLTDGFLEHLVTYSKSSLQELNVSYCTGLTDQGMGYLVDHCGIQLRHVILWGLAQLTDTFLDGHRRVHDPTLVLTGIWMKKSSSRTIQ